VRAGDRERAALGEPRHRPQEALDQRAGRPGGADVLVQAALEHGEPGRGGAQRAGHADQVARERA
jgi:hypothetical protein